MQQDLRMVCVLIFFFSFDVDLQKAAEWWELYAELKRMRMIEAKLCSLLEDLDLVK